MRFNSFVIVIIIIFFDFTYLVNLCKYLSYNNKGRFFPYLQLKVHTPDSSRYWIAQSYEERFQNGLEPENVDKVCFLLVLFRYY